MSKQMNKVIIDGFNALRNEQRSIASKLYELENDMGEHRIVIESLKVVNEDRKCYRMVGGVLVELVVSQVLPELDSNVEQLKLIIEGLNHKLVEKGKELVVYKEKNNIKFQNERIPEEEEP